MMAVKKLFGCLNIDSTRDATGVRIDKVVKIVPEAVKSSMLKVAKENFMQIGNRSSLGFSMKLV
jgi:hypothetical protein